MVKRVLNEISMAINAVTVLQDHLFCILKQRDKNDNTWKEVNLPLIRHPWQKTPSHVIALIHFKMQHLSYKFWTWRINILPIFYFLLSNFKPKNFCKSSTCSFHLSRHQVIKDHGVCCDGYLSLKQTLGAVALINLL